MVCTRCRQPRPVQATFCFACGARVDLQAVPGPPETFDLQCSLSDLSRLAERYAVDDDEVLAMGRAARSRGHYRRSELVALCRWRNPMAQRLVSGNSEEAVAAATSAALAADHERARLTSLTGLHGVTVPSASVLLHFAFPQRYPIIDTRALEALGEPAREQYPVSYWVEYAAYCRRLAARVGLTLRQLDKALWQYSFERSQEARAA